MDAQCLARAAQEAGIAVKRSQIRRIYLREGCAGVTPIVGVTVQIQDFVPKNGGRHPLYPATRRIDDHLHRRTRTSSPAHLPPAPGWSADGHRIKAPMDYSRGPEKTWVYGAFECAMAKLTRCAASRNSKGYIASLIDIEADNPTGDIFIITDNLSSHNSLRPALGWPSIRASTTSSFPKERAGSICKRAGGGSSVAMRCGSEFCQPR